MNVYLSNKRIEWIDTAKLIGMFFVILGHVEYAIAIKSHDTRIVQWLYSFHMPLFFFLSGLTAKQSSIMGNLKKSIHHLIIPYFSFVMILWFWHILIHFRKSANKFTELFLYPLNGLFLGVGFDTDFSISVCGALWFLLALFWCKLIASLVDSVNCKSRTKKALNLTVCIAFFAIAFVLNKTNRFLPLSLGSAFMAYPFFLLGRASLPFLIKVFEKSQSKRYLLLFAGFTCYILVFLGGGTDE